MKLTHESVAILCHEAGRHLSRGLGHTPDVAWGRLTPGHQNAAVETIREQMWADRTQTEDPYRRLFEHIIDAVRPLFTPDKETVELIEALESEPEPVRDDELIPADDLREVLSEARPDLEGVDVLFHGSHLVEPESVEQ